MQFDSELRPTDALGTGLGLGLSIQWEWSRIVLTRTIDERFRANELDFAADQISVSRRRPEV